MQWVVKMRERIIKILQQEFHPLSLEVIDESHKHQGHAGYAEGGESHFKIIINSPKLTPLTPLQAHRAIYEALGEVMNRVHAVSINNLSSV